MVHLPLAREEIGEVLEQGTSRSRVEEMIWGRQKVIKVTPKKEAVDMIKFDLNNINRKSNKVREKKEKLLSRHINGKKELHLNSLNSANPDSQDCDTTIEDLWRGTYKTKLETELIDFDSKIVVNENKDFLNQENNKFDEKITCDLCDADILSDKYRFKSEKSLTFHKIRKHAGFKVCCSNKYSTSKSLRTHYKTKHGFSRCCNISFRTRKQLIDHKNMNQCIKKMCPMCSKVLSGKGLMTHIREIHTGEELKCEYCSYSTRRKLQIKRHVAIRHEGTDSFMCGECGEKLGSKTSLTRHVILKHEDARPKTLFCNQCDKSFALKHGLSRHIDNVHLQKKDKLCLYCDYKTYSNFNLRLHASKMHITKYEKV